MASKVFYSFLHRNEDPYTVTDYYVYRQEVSGTNSGSYTQVATLQPSGKGNPISVSGVDTVPHCGVTYNYKCSAVNAQGETFAINPVLSGISFPCPSPSRTPTASPTRTPSITPSLTITPTISQTSAAVTVTPTITETITPTQTQTLKVTQTITPTITETPSITPTISQTPSITPTISQTPTITPTITVSTSSPIGSCFGLSTTGISIANNGASSYELSQGGKASENNACMALERGTTYKLTISSAGHPFYIKSANSLGSADAYNNGVTNNGTAAGDILFNVPCTAPDELFYKCQNHGSMSGVINIYGTCPTVTPTISVSPTITPTVSKTNSVTPTVTVSSTITPTVTPTISITNTPTISNSVTVTPTISNSLTPSVSLTSSVTPTITVSSTITPTVTPTISITNTPTISNSVTPTITLTPTISQSVTPTITLTPTISESVTPTISVTNTPTISNSVTPTITLTPTISQSVTPTISVTTTPTPTITISPSTAAASEEDETFVFKLTDTYALANTAVNSATQDTNGGSFSGMGSWTRSAGTATGFYIVEAPDLAGVDYLTDSANSASNAFNNTTSNPNNIYPDAFSAGSTAYRLWQFHGLKWAGSDWTHGGDGASDVIPYDATYPPTIKANFSAEPAFFSNPDSKTLHPGDELTFTVKWLF